MECMVEFFQFKAYSDLIYSRRYKLQVLKALKKSSKAQNLE